MKKIFLFSLLAFLSMVSRAEILLLDVGVEQFIEVPDVPYGVIDKAIWDCDASKVVFVEKSKSGATIKITSYFDNAAVVSLLYVVKYYDNKGFTRSYTGIKYYSVQCKGSAPMIVPSGIALRKGESYQLHISPSSYESQAIWSDWSGSIATKVNSSGKVTAKDVGTGIVFATLPNVENPLSCLVYVKDTKLSISTNVSSGTVERGTEVTLTASKSSAKIYYTLDGSSPEMNGDLYTAPIQIMGNVTLKAIASDENYESSDVLEREYTVKEETGGSGSSDISGLDNVIYIDKVEAYVGDTLTLPIKMKNSVPIRGFQFNLYLPQSVSAVKNSKGRIQASLCAERLEEDDEHTLSATEQNDGSILFLCGSEYDETFTGNDGEVASVKLYIPENMERGDYSISLKNIKLTESNISNHYDTPAFNSLLKVKTIVPGDVNGDYEIDVYDYIGVANRIHRMAQEGFVETAADVDASGEIDIYDYIGVANLIHTGSIYGDVLHATITTNDASNIGEKDATLNGTLTVTSATKPYTVGFFVSSDGTPSNENNIKMLECGSNKTGNFSSTVSGLDYTTTYYYCAYILYEGVYYYGETKSFTTTKKTTYDIGDLYPADNPVGFVFAINLDRKSGMIASLKTAYTNWDAAYSWARAYGKEFGESSGAWRLPTRSQLQQIARNASYFRQKNLISTGSYWSSEEDVFSSGAIYTYAYIVDIGTSSNGSSASRNANSNYHVVAVRSF